MCWNQKTAMTCLKLWTLDRPSQSKSNRQTHMSSPDFISWPDKSLNTRRRSNSTFLDSSGTSPQCGEDAISPVVGGHVQATKHLGCCDGLGVHTPFLVGLATVRHGLHQHVDTASLACTGGTESHHAVAHTLGLKQLHNQVIQIHWKASMTLGNMHVSITSTSELNSAGAATWNSWHIFLEAPNWQQLSDLFAFVLFVASNKRILSKVCILSWFVLVQKVCLTFHMFLCYTKAKTHKSSNNA